MKPNWAQKLNVTAASTDELVSGMEELGWHHYGSTERWVTFQKGGLTVYVKLLEGVPFSYQVLGGDLDSETSKLLEGMM